jgi:hypothetical protein
MGMVENEVKPSLMAFGEEKDRSWEWLRFSQHVSEAFGVKGFGVGRKKDRCESWHGMEWNLGGPAKAKSFQHTVQSWHQSGTA